MTINKLIKLILALSIVTSVATASERASISATATVIPMLGIMPSTDYSNSLFVHTQSASKLSIQAPKKSALIIHLENQNGDISNLLLTPTLTQKNSVSDFFSVELSEQDATQVITIIPIDN